jgi:hypothetical protein
MTYPLYIFHWRIYKVVFGVCRCSGGEGDGDGDGDEEGAEGGVFLIGNY